MLTKLQLRRLSDPLRRQMASRSAGRPPYHTLMEVVKVPLKLHAAGEDFDRPTVLVGIWSSNHADWSHRNHPCAIEAQRAAHSGRGKLLGVYADWESTLRTVYIALSSWIHGQLLRTSSSISCGASVKDCLAKWLTKKLLFLVILLKLLNVENLLSAITQGNVSLKY